MAFRVAVIGGAGHLGSRAVESLKALADVEVTVASRRGPVRVDLGDPSTFAALDGFDAIVDLADTTTTRPDALAAYCLEKGLLLIEATSDAEAVQRLHDTLRGREGQGAVILGAGIFTGLSNLLARDAADRAGSARRIEIAIRSSPYSGAGRGTVVLMGSALRTATRSWDEGREVVGPPVAAGPRFPFPSGDAPSLHVPLAEAYMMHASTGAPTSRAYLSPRPSVLVLMFRAIPGFLLRRAWFVAFMTAYFSFLRRFVLRSVASAVEMVVVARGDREVIRTLSAPDGMRTGGAAIAGIVAALRTSRPTGVRFVDDVTTLDAVLANMGALPGGNPVIIGHGRRRADPLP